MRNSFKTILIGCLLGVVWTQNSYRSVENIQTEWNNYTTYQKEEMVSFCDFLFKEGYYERCLLTAFQLLYKFPDDPLSSTINYYIARCYEEMQNYKLAHRYYRQVIEMENESSIIYKAAIYRDTYIHLIADEINELLEKTNNTEDPYLMTFRGYAFMKKLKWENARTTFITAQEIFNHGHYNKLMTPLYQTIENVSSVPSHNRYLVFLSGWVMPGGGQFMLKEWDKGQGVLTSVGLLMLISYWSKVESLVGGNRFIYPEGTSIPTYKNYQLSNSVPNLTKPDKIPEKMSISSNSSRFMLPPIAISVAIFVGSTIKSFFDTQHKNERLVEYYIQERIDKISPERFLDFPEPTLVTL